MGCAASRDLGFRSCVEGELESVVSWSALPWSGELTRTHHPNPTSPGITLEVRNSAWWAYLCHRNWQIQPRPPAATPRAVHQPATGLAAKRLFCWQVSAYP